MLRELKEAQQVPGQGYRRWFHDDYFHLIVWCDDQERPQGFELCYDVGNVQRSLSWHPRHGYTHGAVDEGEERPDRAKASPIVVSDGAFDLVSVSERFKHASAEMDVSIRAFVLKKLKDYGHGQ